MADSSCLHRPLSTTDFVTKATFSSAWTLKNVVFMYIYYKYDLQNPFIDNIILHRASLRVRNTRRIGRNWFLSSLKVCLVETFIAKQTLTRNWNRLISNEIQYNKVLTSRILGDGADPMVSTDSKIRQDNYRSVIYELPTKCHTYS